MWTCQLNHYKLRPPTWWDLGKLLTAQPTCRLWLRTMCFCSSLYIAVYYVCNISFPAFRNVLLFLEKFVYNLKQSVSKLPLSILTLHHNLQAVT